MKKLNLKEIKTIVDMLDQEEFELLKEAVNERNLEETALALGETDHLEKNSTEEKPVQKARGLWDH